MLIFTSFVGRGHKALGQRWHERRTVGGCMDEAQVIGATKGAERRHGMRDEVMRHRLGSMSMSIKGEAYEIRVPRYSSAVSCTS
jgi:hypothetical protein